MASKEKNTAEQWVWLMGPIKVSERRHALIFTFAGRTADGSVRKLSLNYNATTRQFGASHGPAPHNGQWNKLATHGDDLLGKFGKEVSSSGKLRDLLRSQLTPEQMARCVALSLTHGRK